MTELIIKMLVCLLIALLIGFVIGWLLSKIAQSKKHLFEIDVLGSTLNDKNKHIEMLEKQFSEKETSLSRYSSENIKLKESLVEKNNEIMSMAEKFKKLNLSMKNNMNYQEKIEKLELRVKELSDEVEAKTKELEEFETVLIKAEETIEKARLKTDTHGVGSFSQSEEELQSRVDELRLKNDEKERRIAHCQEKVLELENELKLYTTNGEEDEFIVSKDQFTHIEEQLVRYQEEIKELQEENSRLAQSPSKKIKENSTSDMDDLSVVKLFRETYEKITKP